MAGFWTRVFPLQDREQNHSFTATPGISKMPPRNAIPIDYFELFFSLTLLREIVRQTNRYAQHFIRNAENHLGRYSRARDWKRLTIEEFKKFLAVMFNMGLLRKPAISDYWQKKYPSQKTSWFRAIMSRNRFQNILKFLHVADFRRIADRQHPAYNPAARFEPHLTYINNRFRSFCTPHRDLCIDETLVASKGRNIMRQYIPTKAAKYGIKFWVLCEACSGYILQMLIYKGKQHETTPRGQLQGTNVVMELLKSCQLLNKGYHIFCDNFFCSLDLARRLLEKITFITGTIRKNRPMPMSIKNPDLQPGSSIYMRTGQILCMAYRGETSDKPVRLLSTLKAAGNLQTGKPKVVSSYNKYMGTVDMDDAMMSAYERDRRSSKVWKKMVLHLFHRMLLNSYILYTKNTSDRSVKSRLEFYICIIESLASVNIQINADNQRQREPTRTVRLPPRKEKDCCECSDRKKYGTGVRRRSRTKCSNCHKGLHTHCLPLHMCYLNEI